MARNIVQGLLEDAIKMDGYAMIEFSLGPALFVLYGNPGLLLERWQVSLHGAFEAGVVEQNRVEGMRERTNLFESRLRHFLDLPQVGFVGAGFGGRPPLGASQHRSNGGENLAELIV